MQSMDYIWDETDIGRTETLTDYRGRRAAVSQLRPLPFGRTRVTRDENAELYLRLEMS